MHAAQVALADALPDALEEDLELGLRFVSARDKLSRGRDVVRTEGR